MENNENTRDCDICDKKIVNGKAYVTIIRNIEQMEHDLLKNEDEIEVIDSVELITFCGGCGNNFNTETLISLIKSISPDNNKIRQN